MWERAMDEMPIGVMTWVLGDPFTAVKLAQDVGVETMQLGCPREEYSTGEKLREFKNFVEQSGIRITMIFCGYEGENYADVKSIRETVGFRNPKLRTVRIERTFQISDFAKRLGVKAIAAHIGFVPEDSSEHLFNEMIEVVRKIADYCARNGQYFVLETGQESARTLARFIETVGKDNVRVNFDPANMLYYGSGDPIEALELLIQYIIGVHCKDVKMPSEKQREIEEVSFGEGNVGAERFIRRLNELGYKGPLTIEREVTDPQVQIRDIIKGKKLIEELKKNLATSH